MRRCAALLAGLLLTAAVAAGDFRAAGDLTIERDTLGLITADDAPEKATVFWDYDEERVSAREDGRKLYWTAKPGTYSLRLRYVMLDKDGKTVSETKRLKLTVKGAPDPGPGPGPGPAPSPDDALTKSLKDAWAKEQQTEDTRAQMDFLSAIYSGAGPLADASETAGELFGKLSKAIHADGVGLPKGALPEVSRAVGARLALDLGTSPAAALDRSKAKASLAAIGQALRKTMQKKEK